MKKTMFVLLLLIIAEMLMSARTYPIKNFDAIRAGAIYDVTVTKGGSFKVDVEASDNLTEYLDVRLSGHTLILGMRGYRGNYKKGDFIKASVTMPDLDAIDLSGASSMTINGDFKSRDNFTAELSGAAHLRDLAISADRVEIELSGAGKAENISAKSNQIFIDLSGSGKLYDASLKAESCLLDLSGAGKINAEINCTILNVDASGAAKASLGCINVGRVSAEAGGSASITLDGRKNSARNIAEKISVDAGGAAYFDAASILANDVSVNAGGAAKVTVSAARSLSAEGSGAAKIYYYLDDKVQSSHISCSGGAKANRMN